MNRILAAAAALTAALVLAVAAGAITYGSPDGNDHPEVGALLAAKAYSDGTWEYCTGTLIAPNVVLTAAHCDDGRSPRRRHVRLVLHASKGGTKYWGTFHGDPAYNQAQSDPHDIAVIVLDKTVRGITPARLPKAGSLGNLPSDQQFTSVGYGAQSVTMGAGGANFHYADIRYAAVGTLNATNPAWLRISMNPAHRRRRHLLRRLGRPELPRRRRGRDRHRRRDDDHRRLRLPRDERDLPPRHAVGAGVPRAAT